MFPLNAVHARGYALLGTARAAAGLAPVLAWGANPWDAYAPPDLPDGPTGAAACATQLNIAAMRGENRALALNLSPTLNRIL